MPETPEGIHHSPSPIPSPVQFCNFCFKNNNQSSRDGHVTVLERPQTVSFVTVGKVTETSVESGLVEWMEMESDTCPRFISDGGDRVVWKNKAYKEMAAGGEEVMVVLVRKEGSWPAAFTCNARVTCRVGMSCSTLTVPCDAWRMGVGGYAWGLDVKAALCLGR
ncbi:hypothetical protein L1987_48092 [Smallanthus sonchifolius]|uniref:Uncharacterized protein n=1 Tax=Smallanthus sonchifolius TaxID=185202 RepID=A0ACB9FSM0_9ASTR|nr:hypothetical protein L1987_48092 [Smallanthus sonchifolius]